MQLNNFGMFFQHILTDPLHLTDNDSNNITFQILCSRVRTHLHVCTKPKHNLVYRKG